ncbi:MAG: diacylglycerol kinase family lipid kinase [Hungatella sp.]|jgi:YegS/Rv2252/BmrU family lipid kinase|nr:diacylglycerol kinase family lipid kinase [Hungatella sp.]
MYYFIVNPNAKGGGCRKIWMRLERQLTHLGVDYEAFLTEKQGDAAEYAAKLTEGCREPRVIITVGGDGTMNEVLDGLAFLGPVTLGYIPAGCGNDLARSLKLPRRPLRCLKKILNPKYYKLLDYGVMSYGEKLEHRRFLTSAGIGMDGAVCHRLMEPKVKQALNKLHLGKLSYAIAGVRQLIFSYPVKGYLLLDGTQKVELNHIYFISVHNLPYEGGGFKFAPAADPCDGKLTLCVVHHSSKMKLIPFLISSVLGHHKKYRGVRSYHCQEAEIHVERPMAVHADGESCMCQKELQFRCIPGKVRLIV